jgi:uncharacterized protein YkwD
MQGFILISFFQIPTRHRSLRFVATLLLGFLVVLPLSPSEAEAIPKPKVRVDSLLDQVVLRASFKRRAKFRRSKIVVQTSINGRGFAEIVRFAGRKRNSITFYAGTSGVYTFRAQSVDDRGRASAWTAPRSILVTVPDEFVPKPPTTPEEPADVPWPELTADLGECPEGIESQVLNSVNARRAEVGLPALVRRYELQVAARNHSIWMAENLTMVHDGWFEEILETGMSGTHFSQNIARYISDPVGLVDAWLSSPNHAKNMLNSKDSMTGISCIVAPNGQYYWTQDFAG